jgi:chromosome segregation ATPase
VIENFVKVTQMEQMLEDYQAELDDLRLKNERIQQEKDAALKREKEKDRKIAEMERKIADLEKNKK